MIQSGFTVVAFRSAFERVHVQVVVRRNAPPSHQLGIDTKYQSEWGCTDSGVRGVVVGPGGLGEQVGPSELASLFTHGADDALQRPDGSLGEAVGLGGARRTHAPTDAPGLSGGSPEAGTEEYISIGGASRWRAEDGKVQVLELGPNRGSSVGRLTSDCSGPTRRPVNDDQNLIPRLSAVVSILRHDDEIHRKL